MSFIKFQKIVRDEDGKVISGSAAIVDSVYDPSRDGYHSKQVVREKLGKVISLSDDKKSGVFLSPTRGLVSYNSKTDTFNEIEDKELYPNDNGYTEIHTVFGDSYLLLNFLKNCGMIDVLKNVFTKKEMYERVLAHVIHGILKDGSKITCDNYIHKSFASYLFENISIPSLKSDTRFYTFLGDDQIKIKFFKSFIEKMRQTNPDFGRGCYVDSTPLPNDITDNPFNALSSHGVASTGVMSRLVVVLDEDTGLPVWYDIICGNIIDLNTIMNVIEKVAITLDVEIDSIVVDAGYVSKELIETFHIGQPKVMIGRMPARKGYPYKQLYWDVKNLIPKGKYAFVREKHAYFGVRKEINLFSYPMYAYVYVDKTNALSAYTKYLIENAEEYDSMKAKDKDWISVKGGYFVLLSSIEMEPKNLLDEYFNRTNIEQFFKTSKEYLGLLPLAKWNTETINGKILHDMIDTISYLSLRKTLKSSGYSTTEIIGSCQSLMCFRNNNGDIIIETPNKKVKTYYSLFGVPIPSRIKLSKYSKSLLLN